MNNAQVAMFLLDIPESEKGQDRHEVGQIAI